MQQIPSPSGRPNAVRMTGARGRTPRQRTPISQTPAPRRECARVPPSFAGVSGSATGSAVSRETARRPCRSVGIALASAAQLVSARLRRHTADAHTGTRAVLARRRIAAASFASSSPLRATGARQAAGLRRRGPGIPTRAIQAGRPDARDPGRVSGPARHGPGAPTRERQAGCPDRRGAGRASRPARRAPQWPTAATPARLRERHDARPTSWPRRRQRRL